MKAHGLYEDEGKNSMGVRGHGCGSPCWGGGGGGLVMSLGKY